MGEANFYYFTCLNLLKEYFYVNAIYFTININ